MKNGCTVRTRVTKVKVEQRKQKVIFLNNKKEEYSVTLVDDCLIKEGRRCDYLVSNQSSATVLVELKGVDVDHACSQLKASMDYKCVQSLIIGQVGFLVVAKKFPRFDTIVARTKSRFAKRYGAGFHVICQRKEIDIDEVVKIDGRI